MVGLGRAGATLTNVFHLGVGKDIMANMKSVDEVLAL